MTGCHEFVMEEKKLGLRRASPLWGWSPSFSLFSGERLEDKLKLGLRTRSHAGAKWGAHAPSRVAIGALAAGGMATSQASLHPQSEFCGRFRPFPARAPEIASEGAYAPQSGDALSFSAQSKVETVADAVNG